MRFRSGCAAAVILLLGSLAWAVEPVDPSRGDKMLDAYFRDQTKHIRETCLANFKTKADWERQRPELRRQFFEMIGLDPLPRKTDLKPVVTGKIDTENFVLEKLHFQSMPGLYVSANLYVPKKVKFPCPAVLYVCGHGSTTIDKIPYGNKHPYQHHGVWFAENGYVCLIVDTLQLGEIQGLHHGTSRFNMWWWQTLGYSSAGIECWNAVRALDYLETRKEVDAKKLGVTGRSGGGATSWWLAAADDRVQCIIPVAGIADLHAHCVEGQAQRLRKGVVSGHCDCMYVVNTYRWDYSVVAALCAPRPLMLGNSDSDDIFPVEGYRRLAEDVRKIYDLYGAADKFVLLETAGPHRDTPELRLGANKWMNRWLKGDMGEVKDIEKGPFSPQELRVFEKYPEDAINAIVHESFVRPARLEIPQSGEVAREWWGGKSRELRQALKEKVFRGWATTPADLNARPAADVKHDGLRLRAFDFVSETGVELRLWLLTAEKVDKPSLVVLTAVDEAGWQEWCQELGPAFKEALLLKDEPKLDALKFAQNRKTLEFHRWAFATVTPRGIGPTRWNDKEFGGDHQIRRRFALIGQTLDGQRVWDVRRGLEVLRGVPDLKGVSLWLQGKGDLAGVVLYASLFEPDIDRLDLWHPTPSHRQGPIFLNVRRFLDVPQALALAFPKQIRLYVKDETEAREFDWTVQLQQKLGQDCLKIRQIGE